MSVMQAIPAKLTSKLVKEMDVLVKEGLYSSRSEILRDAVRQLIYKKQLKQLTQAVEEDIEWGLHGK
ncbi:MAG: ribbon-helix-helix domain-containing protein [Candidatus Diapherotrites archaeon]|nr:ribbon-helix-helix domain-containing protein [Candidatus Diapherotrites archaeon]